MVSLYSATGINPDPLISVFSSQFASPFNFREAFEWSSWTVHVRDRASSNVFKIDFFQSPSMQQNCIVWNLGRSKCAELKGPGIKEPHDYEDGVFSKDFCSRNKERPRNLGIITIIEATKGRAY